MLRKTAHTWMWLVGLVLLCYFSHVSVAPALEWVQQAKLHADDGAGGDYFGKSVCLSEGTAIVGAYGDNDNGLDSGSVYIFEHRGSGWTQTAKLLPNDGEEQDSFGWSVSVSGRSAIVGVNPDEDVYGNQGWAYIFQQEDTGWTQVYKSPRWNGYFGRSVAIDGSVAIVGAPESSDDDTPYGPVYAYIFEQTDSGWHYAARLHPDDPQPRNGFGRSVSVHGDRLLVGAAESAYIFERADAGWTQVAKLLPEDGEVQNYFGAAVAISDGTAIVGAERDDDNRSDSGAAYVFQESDLGWTQVAKLLADDAGYNDYLGNSVAISGTRAIVGAEEHDDVGINSGAAYIFEETELGWQQIDKLVAEDSAEYQYLGASVSIDGDTALVGARSDDSLFPSAGAAYVFVVSEPCSVALLVAAGAGLLIFTLFRRR